MGLQKATEQLKIEKEKLEHAIALLEELQNGGGSDLTDLVPKRRGRKSMAPEERREVSQRMKKYWAGRRQNKPE